MSEKPPAIIIEEPPEKPRANRCETCSAGLFNKTETMGQCRAKPPVTFIFLVPAQNLAGKVSPTPISQSGWPAVRRDNFCRDGWQPKQTN